jgi:uncharacterized protein YjiS (DUF1127 family)
MSAPDHLSRSIEEKQRQVDWGRRGRSGADFLQLDDITQEDIGLSRRTSGFEASRPFWLARSYCTPLGVCRSAFPPR